VRQSFIINEAKKSFSHFFYTNSLFFQSFSNHDRVEERTGTVLSSNIIVPSKTFWVFCFLLSLF